MSNDKLYHELPDIGFKLIRILVQCKVLPQSAHQVNLTILDRFNSNGTRERECFEGSSGIARRAGLGKKRTNEVADQLAELGIFRLRYRVWLNNPTEEFKDFTDYEEALSFVEEYEKISVGMKHPTLVRLYTPSDKLPTPEDLGLTCLDPINHIYSAPDKLKKRGKKRSAATDKNTPTSVSKQTPPSGPKSALNDTNINYTNVNETKLMGTNNSLVGAEVPKSFPAEGLEPSSPFPDELSNLLTAFEKKYESVFGRKIPSQQLSEATDVVTKIAIEKNIRTVKESGGTFDEWVDCEFNRLKRNATGKRKYRTPQLKFLGNVQSVSEYLDFLNGRDLRKKMNPLSNYFTQSEFEQCLTKPPEEDLLLIRYQVLLRAYMDAKSREEVAEKLKMLPTYAHFFELDPKPFLYVGTKYLSFTGRRIKKLLVLAKRFSDENGDTSFVSILKDKGLKQSISNAKMHLQRSYA